MAEDMYQTGADFTFDRAVVYPVTGLYLEASSVSTINEATSQPEAWVGFADEERGRVEMLIAAGLEQLAATPRTPNVLTSVDERAASLLQSVVDELARDGKIDIVELASGSREAKFDSTDLGWASWLVQKLARHFLVGTFKFLAPPTEPTVLAEGARFAVLGDWGSNRYGAPHCAQQIETDPEGFDALVHLGDVYYSGTEDEVRGNFLSPWPWDTRAHTVGHPPVNRACNSNHEMYSGGHAYSNMTLREFNQSSSCFALASGKWLFIGMDTAYDEGTIGKDQLDWFDSFLSTHRHPYVVLFSHHHPYSPVKGATKLLPRIEDLFRSANGRIRAWYWGHEHIGAIFEPDAHYGFRGRCVGHSGFPYFREVGLEGLPLTATGSTSWLVRTGATVETPAAIVVDGPNMHIGANDNPMLYGPNGYMTLTVDGDRLLETLHEATGEVLWQSSFDGA